MIAILKDKRPTFITASGTAAAPGLFLPQSLVCTEAEANWVMTGIGGKAVYVYHQDNLVFNYPVGEDRRPYMIQMGDAESEADDIQAGVVLDTVQPGSGQLISRAARSWEWKSNPPTQAPELPTQGNADIMNAAGAAAAAEAQWKHNVESMLQRIVLKLGA